MAYYEAHMTRLPQPGGDDDTWGSILNDFLTVEHNTDGSLKRGAAIDVATTQAAQALAAAQAAQTAVGGAEQVAHKGQANGYAGLGVTGVVPAPQLGAGSAVNTHLTIDGSNVVGWRPAGIPLATISLPGVLAAGTVSLPFPLFGTWQFEALLVDIGTAPVGAAVIVDLLYNGTSIYSSTPGNRPTVAAGSNWAASGTPNTTVFTGSASQRGYLQFSAAQIGAAGTEGADLVATLYAIRTA